MLHEMYDGLLVMDHFDDCIIGVVRDRDWETLLIL
jgi:hypothetical protein